MKELIRERRLAPREQGKVLGCQIVELRRAKRQDWLANVLSRARGGDFAAPISGDDNPLPTRMLVMQLGQVAYSRQHEIYASFTLRSLHPQIPQVWL